MFQFFNQQMKRDEIYLNAAVSEAKKSVMTHAHGCISIDNKTGQILSRSFNDWTSSFRFRRQQEWLSRQKEDLLFQLSC